MVNNYYLHYVSLQELLQPSLQLRLGPHWRLSIVSVFAQKDFKQERMNRNETATLSSDSPNVIHQIHILSVRLVMPLKR